MMNQKIIIASMPNQPFQRLHFRTTNEMLDVNSILRISQIIIETSTSKKSWTHGGYGDLYLPSIKAEEHAELTP